MGIEPITTGLQGRCSTIEPRWRVETWYHLCGLVASLTMHRAHRTWYPAGSHCPLPAEDLGKFGAIGRTQAVAERHVEGWSVTLGMHDITIDLFELRMQVAR